jgi:predicted peroxiredoxin
VAVTQYVLIESRDPFEYGDSLYMYDLAGDLASKGNDVTLFLIQNGVLTTRKGVKNNPLTGLHKKAPSVKVSVDDFSLRERGIARSSIVEGASVSSVDNLVDLLVQNGTKIVWH